MEEGQRRFGKVLTPVKSSSDVCNTPTNKGAADEPLLKPASAPLDATMSTASEALLKPTKSTLAKLSANKENITVSSSSKQPQQTPTKKRSSPGKNTDNKVSVSAATTPSEAANIYEVIFPEGSMGLELEPVLISSERKIGCRVKDYYFGIDHSGIDRDYVVKTIQVGDIIVSINNDNIQTGKFMDILNILKLKRNDSARKVVFKRLLSSTAISQPARESINSFGGSSNNNVSGPSPLRNANNNSVVPNSPFGKDIGGSVEAAGSSSNNTNLIDNFLPIYSKNEMNQRESKSNTILNELSRSVFDYRSLETNHNTLLIDYNKVLESSKLSVNSSKERIFILSQELEVEKESNKNAKQAFKNEILSLKNEWKLEKEKLEAIINDLSNRNFELENRSDPLAFNGSNMAIAINEDSPASSSRSSSSMLSCLLEQKEGEILEMISEKNNLMSIIASKNSIIDQLNATNNLLRDNGDSNTSKIESLITSLDNKESTIIKLNAEIANSKHLIDVLNTRLLNQTNKTASDADDTLVVSDTSLTTAFTDSNHPPSNSNSNILQLITNNNYNNYINRIESLNFEATELREKNAHYEKSLSDINKLLNEKKDVIRRLKNDVVVKGELYATIANEKIDLESRLSELSVEKNNLHIDLNNKDILIDNYLADITDKGKIIDALSKEKDAAMQQGKELKCVLSEMIAEGVKIKQVIDANNRTINQLNGEVSVLKETISANLIVISRLKCDVEEKQAQIILLNNEIVDSSSTINALKVIESGSKNDKEQFLLAIQQNNEIHSKLIDGLKQEISERNVLIEKFRHEISNLKCEIQNRDHILTNNKTLTENNNLFKHNIILLESENKQYKSSLDALESNQKFIISENEILRDEKSANERITVSLEKKCSDIIAVYKGKLAGFTTLIAAMKEEHIRVKDELMKLLEFHVAIQTEQKRSHVHFSDKISELSIKNYDLYENEKKLLLEMKENEEKVVSLEKRYAALISKSVHTEKLLIETSKDRDTFVCEANKKNDINNRLIASLKDEIDIKNSSLNSMTAKYHSLNNEFHFDRTKYEVDLANLQNQFTDELNSTKLNSSKEISKHEIDLINRINNRRIEHEHELSNVKSMYESRLLESQSNYNSIISNLKNKITDLNAVILNYKTDNDDLHTENLELQLTTKNSIQMMSDVKINSLNSEVTINSLNDEILFLRSKLIDCNTYDSSSDSSRYSSFIGSESDSMMSIKNLQTENSLNKITIESLKNELQQTKNMYKENYLNLQKLKRNEENLQTEKLILMNEINSYKNSLELSEKTINKLSRDILSTQGEYESMKANESQMSNKLVTCEIELIEIKESFEDVSNKQVLLENSKNALNSMVARLKNELSELNAKYTLLQASSASSSSLAGGSTGSDVYYPKEKINELINTIFLQRSCLDECEKRDVEHTEQVAMYKMIISNLEEQQQSCENSGDTYPNSLNNESVGLWLMEMETGVNNLNENLLNGILLYNDIVHDDGSASMSDGSKFLQNRIDSSSSFVNVANVGKIKSKIKGLSQFFTEFSDKIHKIYLFMKKNPFGSTMNSTFLPAHIFAKESFLHDGKSKPHPNPITTAMAARAHRTLGDDESDATNNRSPPCPIAKQLSRQSAEEVKLKPIPFDEQH